MVLFCANDFSKAFSFFLVFIRLKVWEIHISWNHKRTKNWKKNSKRNWLHCQVHNYNCGKNLPFPKQAHNFCTNTCHILIIYLLGFLNYHVIKVRKSQMQIMCLVLISSKKWTKILSWLCFRGYGRNKKGFSFFTWRKWEQFM